MTDVAPTQFTLFGEPNAAVCDGDFCVIPEHPEQATVNRRLDSNNI